ncbi:MAG TPA: acyl CoA:acetate/3-ketoacid CoA transferase [Noviherbaspirillum sp.]|uniref:acyl CoA:acetate/3-ketoacid CoA transferase n=1 Tax=Noviherbaspirillum sp. TaxID=1926288 RepID=UPI002D54B694|nr:acyl CoA:acetate/3-ketoacid CoA transferase [Noviherbaspirillum sp.]HYD94371.1 acyl CoA:acetate/3-ketoacid CoA transferase [Noviherbaspirillum sp.]
MRKKVVSAAEAIAILHDGDTLCCSGFGSNGVPVELILALEKRFLETGSPKNLTLLFGGGPGDGAEGGVNHLAHEGMLKRVIGGHYGLLPKIGKLALESKVEAYNLPLGVISHMYRDIACGLPGTVSKVGLGTFVDPRLEGGKIGSKTSEDLVSVVELGGKELLYFKTFPISVAFIRGTSADPEGNITMERETLTQDVLALATATKNSGGFVIAQVERIAERGSLNPRRVKVPGVLVDCVVVARPENHPQNLNGSYNPAFSAEVRVPLDALEAMPLDERKVIARRAAFELLPNSVVNLGIGMPEGVAAVANEEKILRYMTLTAEPGVIGGVPASGVNFGAAVNPDAVIDMNQQFDFYDGGGLDLACLGLAECDPQGSINVSRFGPKLAGAGGFINITQNSRTVVFVGTFTAGGLKTKVEGGKLQILQEGRARKFVNRIEQVTFSGPYAARTGQNVLYVTERCVFRLAPEGLELIEVAPGIDIERDILAQMDFKPIVNKPALMDARIFMDEPMKLKETLLSISLEDRMQYDSKKCAAFYNFQGLRVMTRKDVEDIRHAAEKLCHPVGRKVKVIVNYDDFQIDENIADDYWAMVKDLHEKYYTHVSRYTTSAFMRMKMGTALESRGLAAHIFETQQEAVDSAAEND